MIQGAIFIYLFSIEYQLFYNLLILDSCYSFILVSISYRFPLCFICDSNMYKVENFYLAASLFCLIGFELLGIFVVLKMYE